MIGKCLINLIRQIIGQYRKETNLVFETAFMLEKPQNNFA